MRSFIVFVTVITVLCLLLSYGAVTVGSFIDNNGDINHTLNTINKGLASEVMNNYIIYNPEYNFIESTVKQAFVGLKEYLNDKPTTFDIITIPFIISIRTIKGVLGRNFKGKLPW